MSLPLNQLLWNDQNEIFLSPFWKTKTKFFYHFFEKHLEKWAKMKFFYHLFENLAMFQNRCTGLFNKYVHIQIDECFPNSYFLAPLCQDHFMDILLDYRLYKSLKVTPLKNPLYWKISEHSFDEIHRILLGELFCKIFELWIKFEKKLLSKGENSALNEKN